MRILIWLLVMIVAGLFVSFTVHAETKSEWFKSLTENGTGNSCCDVADCKPASNAHYDASLGQWVADTELGPATPIPNEKVLDTMSYSGQAFACIVWGTVRCFVRPGGGS